MATGAYIGIMDKARRVKAIYVSPEGKARKVRRAYVGVEGRARLWWGGVPTEILPLRLTREGFGIVTLNRHGIIGGGGTGGTGNVTSEVEAYDPLLINISLAPLSVARRNLGAVAAGEFGLFMGGDNARPTLQMEIFSVIDCYDANFVRTSPTILSSGRASMATAGVGNYGLGAGGLPTYNTRTLAADAFDGNITRTVLSLSGNARGNIAGASTESYALFAGGLTYAGTDQNTVDAFDTNLTRRSPTANLSLTRSMLDGTAIGASGIFGGGSRYTSARRAVADVDAYDDNLTRHIPLSLVAARAGLSAVTVDDYALFGGGLWSTTVSNTTTTYRSDVVDAYNAFYTRLVAPALSLARGTSAVNAGNYGLFITANLTSNVVDVFDSELNHFSSEAA